MWQKVWREAQRSSIYIEEYQALSADSERFKWVGQTEYCKFGIEIPELQEELSKFTSSKSPAHFFVREVEVGIHSDLFPNDVYLVDTPASMMWLKPVPKSQRSILTKPMLSLLVSRKKIFMKHQKPSL